MKLYSLILTVKPALLLFVIFSVYIFDPASPCPVAVQAAVSRKTDIIAAAFNPTSLVRDSTEGRSAKMSKLYFLTAKQVSSLFCEFFLWLPSDGVGRILDELKKFDWTLRSHGTV